MNRLLIFGISLAYEAVATLLPFFLIFLLFRNGKKKKGVVYPRYHVLAVLVFAVYVLGVYHFTGAGTLYDIKRFIFIPELINLIPFSNEIDIVAYALNIVLFVPLGLLAPMIWQKSDKLTNILGVGLGFTLLIEVSQLLNFRSTDVDDVILNVLGAAVGFVIYKLWDKITKSKYQVNSPVTVELALCILVSFVSRFFLYNEMGLMSLIYRF
ncbi:MAG: VanZ family protein [Oscillospiraceae bacterium]|nr:VanZ family protein [Oscillospiraceae bacterium]